MTTVDTPSDDLPRLPLKISVTEAGRQAAFRALVRQAVPILKNPESYRMEQRRQMAERLETALGYIADNQIGDAEPEEL